MQEPGLEQTKDPKLLLHGNPKAIQEAAGHLREFHTAFEETYRGLARLDTEHWQGKAAEAFRAKYQQHPQQWANAATACGDAADALENYAHTVTWAQGQAKAAVETYQRGERATKAAQSQYDQSIATFNSNAASYNKALEAGQSPGTKPTAPAPFKDPGDADRASARAILDEARRQRDSSADAAQRLVAAATSLAPKKPSRWQQMKDDLHDVVQDAPNELTRLDGGVIKGVSGILKFARTLNPQDPYNLTHPATYLDGVSTTAAGLVTAGLHPTKLLSAVVGSGWSSDPAQALGKLLPNIALTVGTDGAGAAESVAEDAAVSTTETTAEDAAAKAATDQAAKPGDFSHDAHTSTTSGDPIDVATGRMTLTATDITLPGSLPLAFTRSHNSGNRAGLWMGPSWACTADQRLHISTAGVVFVRADGVVLSYPAPVPGTPTLPAVGSPWPLNRDPHGYTVTDPGTGHQYVFTLYSDSLALLTKVSDRNGNRILFEYASDGTPTAIRHSGGYQLRLTTEQRRITALHLVGAAADGSDAELVRYSYTEGHLAEVVNSSGLPLCFVYDRDGRIAEWTDRNDHHYSYQYDEQGRCTDQGGDQGHLSYHYSYDQRDPATGMQVTTATDSLGHTTRYRINDLYQVVAQADPLGNTAHSRWDRHDRLIERTDPLGRTTTFGYDSAGNLSAVTRPDGLQVLAEYNTQGLPTLITQPDGTLWRQEYDDAGNRTSVTDPAGAVTRYTFDERGRLKAITDPLGHTTRIRCDPAGLPVSVSNPLGATTEYHRDRFGRLVTIVDPLGAKTCLTWTIEGHLATRTEPDGTTQRWAYDGEGNPVEHIDALGQSIRCEYTNFDLLSARISPDGARHEFSYDTELRLTAVANPQGLSWDYTYDAAGRLIQESDFDGRTLSYAYDEASHLISRTNALGQVVSYHRDEVGRVIAKNADGTLTRYRHDPLGRLLHASSPGVDLAFTYDPLGRALTETVNGHTLVREYDPMGRRSARRTPTGAISQWTYDRAGQRTTLTTGGRTLAFERDQAGQEVRRTVGDCIALTQQWDVNHRITEQALFTVDSLSTSEFPGGGTTPEGGTGRRAIERHSPALQARSYSYRADGHLLGIRDHLNGDRSFDIDPAGRITSVKAQGWTERYAYDEAGNVTDAQWPGRSAPAAAGPRSYHNTQIRQAGSVRYEHDAQGRITLRQKTRLSRKPDTWRYTWDVEDRLVAVTTPDGRRWRYLYDPLGRRIAKQRLAEDRVGVVEEVTFTWDGTILAEQTTRDPRLRGPVVLTWDHSGLSPLAQTERLISSETPQAIIDERFYAIVTDLVGSPAELVDEDGGIAWRARTSVWGATTWPASSTAYTPLRFPGQYFDGETELHYNLHRYYDRDTAQYATFDPLGLTPSPNPRAYVNNPLSRADPLGLSPCDVGGGGQTSQGRPDNEIVLSGHGGIQAGDSSYAVVPEGTSFAMYSPHGTSINDAFGNAIETGNPAALEIYQAGEKVPNYTLFPPNGLNIMGNPITVANPTHLSDLLKSNMGRVHWAACREVVP